jgi:hypothetical protein
VASIAGPLWGYIIWAWPTHLEYRPSLRWTTYFRILFRVTQTDSTSQLYLLHPCSVSPGFPAAIQESKPTKFRANPLSDCVIPRSMTSTDGVVCGAAEIMVKDHAS